MFTIYTFIYTFFSTPTHSKYIQDLCILLENARGFIIQIQYDIANFQNLKPKEWLVYFEYFDYAITFTLPLVLMCLSIIKIFLNILLFNCAHHTVYYCIYNYCTSLVDI